MDPLLRITFLGNLQMYLQSCVFAVRRSFETQEATWGHRVYTNGVLEKESTVSKCITQSHFCSVLVVCTVCTVCS